MPKHLCWNHTGIQFCVCAYMYIFTVAGKTRSESREGMQALNLCQTLLWLSEMGIIFRGWYQTGVSGAWMANEGIVTFYGRRGDTCKLSGDGTASLKMKGRADEHKSKMSPYCWSSDNSLGLHVHVQEMIGRLRYRGRVPVSEPGRPG